MKIWINQCLVRRRLSGLAGLFILALSQIHPAQAGASSQSGASFLVTCTSAKKSAQTCHFGFEADSLLLSRRLSASACVKNASWSSTKSSVTVKAGCSAEFRVTSRMARPNVVILTDIGQDPDDMQSLVRTLLYSNDLNIQGLIATYIPRKRPRADLIRLLVDAYGKDHPSLLRHDIRYPAASTLRARIKTGLNSNSKLGAGYDTEGSNHLIAVVDASKAPVWVLVWGGSRELAQALYKVKATRSAAAFAQFQKKLRVYAIGWSQYSPEPAEYMLKHAKDMFWISSAEHDGPKTATFRGNYITGDMSMQNKKWCQANITRHGRLPALYPLNTTENGMKEGDTPSLLHILPTGLGDPSLPSGGGWGGRYTKEPEFYKQSKNLYTARYQADRFGKTQSRRLSVARWRPAFQADFAARAAWTVSSYQAANHPPLARIKGENLRLVRPGEQITLDARSSTDPDGDPLRFKWWVYDEAGTYPSPVPISGAGTPLARLKVPAGKPHQTIVVILEVTDRGRPALTRYQRVTLKFRP